MKEMLFDRYWTNFWIWLSISLTVVIILIVLVVFRNKLLIDKVNASHTKFIRVIVFTLVSIFAIFSLMKLSWLSLDIRFVKSNDCEVFVGEFVEYTRYVESNRPGFPRGKNPLFKDMNSKEEIVLTGTQEYEVGESYTIYYLPNSMVYIVVETNNN